MTTTLGFLLAAFFLLCAAHGVEAREVAQDVLPQAVQAQVKSPLIPMGSGIYRKFGFSVYRITLWSADGTWNPQKSYALEIRYTRDVSKDTLVDTVTDDLRDENVASDETIENWHKILDDVLTGVKEGDTIVSLFLPGKKKSPLFHNERVILWSGDRAFIRAFSDIWLGPNADEDMRDRLLLKP